MNTDKLKELAESAQWISDQVEKNSENPLSYMMQRQIMTAFYTTFTPELALSLIKERDEARDRLKQLTRPTSAIELARAAAAGHTKKEPHHG